jgi:GT2 family glycosyltransferase
MIVDELHQGKNNIDRNSRLGIIILNWNNLLETLRCIDGIRACTYPQIEIYIVDNGSEDESPSLLSKIDDIHFLPVEKNLGFAGGSNVGINAAVKDNCDYVLLLNNDTEFPPDFIQPLLEPFEIDKRAGISCPKILYKEPGRTIWYAGGKFHQPRILGELVGIGKPDQHQYDLMGKTDFAVGTCMLIKREVFLRIGMLDDHFFFYHEDVDFCYRATKAGFNIWYQPKSTIIHLVSTSTENQPDRRVYLYQRARVVFLIKHIRGFKIPVVIFMEIIRLIRVLINGMMHLQMKLPKYYIAGVLAGLNDSRDDIGKN